MARGLRKSYRSVFGAKEVEALRGVDLTAQRGAALGLIGPNGAGKTTLLKILLGLVRTSAGSVTVFDCPPDDVETRQRIGYLPERLHIPASLTARAFLENVARLKRVRSPRIEVARQLERVEMHSHGDAKVGRFSKGMKQRIGLAAALLGRPDLLILDEPTDGIDPEGRAAVRRILLEERARGATIVLNSHLLSETERVCDEICILVKGRIVKAGPLHELCGDPERWTVRFAHPVAREDAHTLGMQGTGDPRVFTCSGADASALNARLDRARQLGLLLVELRSATRTLEDVLLDATGARYG